MKEQREETQRSNHILQYGTILILHPPSYVMRKIADMLTVQILHHAPCPMPHSALDCEWETSPTIISPWKFLQNRDQWQAKYTGHSFLLGFENDDGIVASGIVDMTARRNGILFLSRQVSCLCDTVTLNKLKVDTVTEV